MQYSTLLPKLKAFSKIIVSGPQRSGTTIATEIIAHDLGLTAIREDFLDQLGTRVSQAHFNLWLSTINSRDRFTLQCPKCSHFLHRLANHPDVAVVFTKRPLTQILASQKRISQQSAPGWEQQKEPEYKSYYQQLIQTENIDFKPDWSKPAAQIKYQFWRQYQKPLLPHAFDLTYSSLQHHPLWVSAKNRTKFHHRQTTTSGDNIKQLEIDFQPPDNIHPLYFIPGTKHLNPPDRYRDPSVYPQFQTHLTKFKKLVSKLVSQNKSATFFKFSDGDYYFLNRQEYGTTIQGHTSLVTKNISQIDLKPHLQGAPKNDYICIPIDPVKRNMWRHFYPKRKIDFPADYLYALTANRWFTHTFAGQIGLIGAKEKLDLIRQLLTYPEYQNYLGLTEFSDYITIPQQGSADNLDQTEANIAQQLKTATSKVFLVGIGHVKCALTNRFKKYHKAVYLDVGAGIDALAGIINQNRPYSGNWINFNLSSYDYSTIHLDNYNRLGLGPTKTLDSPPILVIGPWVGEFSYEISWWIPQIRLVKHRQFPHHRTIAIGYTGREALYNDFVDEYIGFPSHVEQSITYPSMHAVLINGAHQVPQEVVNFYQQTIENLKTRSPNLVVAQPNPNIVSQRLLQSPQGIYHHLDTTPHFHQVIKEKLTHFDPKRPLIAVNAYHRQRQGFVGDSPPKTWDPKHWSKLISLMITQLDASVVLFGVPHRGFYPGSLSLSQLPNLKSHHSRILDLVSQSPHSLDRQIAILKNTRASFWGATGAVTLAFFTNTPAFTHQAKEYAWRLNFQWQKQLTRDHRHVSIFDKYSVHDIYSSPATEVFDHFQKFWNSLPQSNLPKKSN